MGARAEKLGAVQAVELSAVLCTEVILYGYRLGGNFMKELFKNSGLVFAPPIIVAINRFFGSCRSQMQTIISRACDELDIKAVPSKRVGLQSHPVP